MFQRNTLALAVLALSAAPLNAIAADSTELQQIRQDIEQLRQSYEARIRELETRLQQTDVKASAAQQATSNLPAQTASAPAANATTQAAGGNAFNPEISLVLSGTYANLSKDPKNWQMSNFMPSGDEIGPGKRGFSLGESELGFRANIDQHFYGQATLAVSGENEIGVEEAFVQTTSLPKGLQAKAGRFFSGIGYLNGQHAHTWDFVDAPLAYQAFLGGQYSQDGAQLKWVAPTSTFLELGMDVGAGERFPGTTRNKNGAGSTALFAHLGGDIGASQSWQVGTSWLRAAPRDRTYDATDLAGNEVSNSFSGRSQLYIVDGVWKWAPNGNAERINLKLQGEYFRRRETGELAYDTAAQNLSDSYRSAQSGWYVQSVYQFMPRWRVGARFDQLDSGTVDYASNGDFLANTNYKPKRSSLMLDWSPSEFSRIRLQYAKDQARQGVKDDQIFVQYQMSLGAHGAHSY
ncbi:TonB-dependent receptor [Uliginosibacterium sp. 31-16]|uniref:TonB-dependent receptor n=1 Tax=Uliginosibacterium sp. 31-16 TaxID=3068315 RepID=UPI00273FBA54|nr:TonB-dependent receptor [Uliginosibacterium sp. 31-16]MDP5240643.1 TonB-dependent receptor [Uliginosibacterium sp. 31-16]